MAKPLSEQTDADIEAAMRSDPDWQDANGNLLEVDWSKARSRRYRVTKEHLDVWGACIYFTGVVLAYGYTTTHGPAARHCLAGAQPDGCLALVGILWALCWPVLAPLRFSQWLFS